MEYVWINFCVRLISRCDAMCPGRWTGGTFSPTCLTCENLTEDFANLSIHPHLINATRTRAVIPQTNPQPHQLRIVPLLSQRLPSPATFLRSRPIGMSPSSIPASTDVVANDHPFRIPFYEDSPGFLTNLKGLFINAVKWSRMINPIEMLSRAGAEFPDLSVSLRSAVITAALIVRSENIFLTAKMKEMEPTHDEFMTEYDKWTATSTDSTPDTERNLDRLDNRPNNSWQRKLKLTVQLYGSDLLRTILHCSRLDNRHDFSDSLS